MRFTGVSASAAVVGALTHLWVAASTVTATVTLTATALIVPGTATPNPATVPNYMENAVDYYIAPTTESCALECVPEPVPYIAQFWPFPWEGWGGLTGAKFDVSVESGVAQLTSDLVGPYNPGADNPIVIFGYSQGATVATHEKSQLSKLSVDDQGAIDFVLIGSPNRPNGGLFERLAMFGTVPILDATFGVPTPTDTAMSTVDIAFQYDGVADFPLYPINLLADLNAIAGFWYTHGSYLSPVGGDVDELPNGLTPAELAAAIADPANQQITVGSDTTYVLVPTPNLPLLQPLRDFGKATGTEFLTTPLIDLIQPALRVLIEAGYDRTLPYATPAPFRLIPRVNPLTLAVDLVNAVGEGIRAAVNDITAAGAPTAAGVRPRATARPMAVTPAGASAASPRSVRAESVGSPPVRKSVAGRAAAGAGPRSNR